MRRLVLVRHGESIWNAEGRIQGQQCAGLTDIGHAQAGHVGAALAAAYPGAQVHVSDLLRCAQTAQPLLDALPARPTVDARLRERHFGDWEGLTREEAAAADPSRWARWREGDDTVLAELGGEDHTSFTARIAPVLRELLAATPDDGATVAVTHGGPVWHGTHALLDLPLATLGPVHNASVTVLASHDGSRAHLEHWNEIAHLPVDLRVGWRPSVRA